LPTLDTQSYLAAHQHITVMPARHHSSQKLLSAIEQQACKHQPTLLRPTSQVYVRCLAECHMQFSELTCMKGQQGLLQECQPGAEWFQQMMVTQVHCTDLPNTDQSTVPTSTCTLLGSSSKL